MPEPLANAAFHELVTRAGAIGWATSPQGGSTGIQSLQLADIEAAVGASGLRVAPVVLAQIHAALLVGKHILLTGAPGTGKTSLAMAVAEAARASGVASGVIQTTASSDWSPSDTVGGYRMQLDGSLAFGPGQMLQAIDANAWIVIDELNRADIDKAMGPLFTVLSGQATQLRYEEQTSGVSGNVAIVPSGMAAPIGSRPYIVQDSWRLIATMNTADLDLLFEMSQAFLRRFAQIEVKPPTSADHVALLAQFATGDGILDNLIQELARLANSPLGPAITLDAAKYAAARRSADVALSAQTIFNESLELFVVPQLGHLPTATREAVRRSLDAKRDESTESASASTPKISPSVDAPHGSPAGVGTDLPPSPDGLKEMPSIERAGSESEDDADPGQ